jgi:hypothetical protein
MITSFSAALRGLTAGTLRTTPPARDSAQEIRLQQMYEGVHVTQPAIHDAE